MEQIAAAFAALNQAMSAKYTMDKLCPECNGPVALDHQRYEFFTKAIFWTEGDYLQET